MKKLYFLLPLFILTLVACSKRDYIPTQVNVQDWMRSHDHGVVAYVDYSNGNYIVETHNGYSVIESWDGSSPVEYDHVYGWFNNRGVQKIYNRQGNYFSDGRIVEAWLNWNEALFVLEDLRYNPY